MNVKLSVNIDDIIDSMTVQDVQDLAESLIDWISDEALLKELENRNELKPETTFIEVEDIDYYY